MINSGIINLEMGHQATAFQDWKLSHATQNPNGEHCQNYQQTHPNGSDKQLQMGKYCRS